MTLFEFGKLSINDRLIALWDYGKYLAYRREGDFYYTFYQLDELYLEMKFNSQSKTFEGFKSYMNPNSK